MGDSAAGSTGYSGGRYRFPGGHLGRILAHKPSGTSGLFATYPDCPYFGRGTWADLYSAVNWLLFVAVVALVIAFRTSSNLASAYGMAVTTTMVITTLLFGIVARKRWQWKWTAVIPLVTLFLTVDLAFFVSNLPKIPDGGWFPLVVGTGICILMATWRNGQLLVAQEIYRRNETFEDFLLEVDASKPALVKNPAIYLMPHQHGVPLSLLYNLRHNQVLHQPIGLLTIVTEDQPWISREHRLEIHELGHDIHRIVARYGYNQPPNVPNVIELCLQQGIDFSGGIPIYFLGRVTLDIIYSAGMFHWQKLLYSLLSRSSDDVSAYFRIPPEQVVEIGVRLSI